MVHHSWTYHHHTSSIETVTGRIPLKNDNLPSATTLMLELLDGACWGLGQISQLQRVPSAVTPSGSQHLKVIMISCYTDFTTQITCLVYTRCASAPTSELFGYASKGVVMVGAWWIRTCCAPGHSLGLFAARSAEGGAEDVGHPV